MLLIQPGKPRRTTSLFDKCIGLFYKRYTPHGTKGFLSHPKQWLSVLIEGLDPHSADQKHQSLNLVILIIIIIRILNFAWWKYDMERFAVTPCNDYLWVGVVLKKNRRFQIDVSINMLWSSSGESWTMMLHAANKSQFLYSALNHSWTYM